MSALPAPDPGEFGAPVPRAGGGPTSPLDLPEFAAPVPRAGSGPSLPLDLPVGPEARRAHATALDTWLSASFRASSAAEVGAALVAVGGLGRRDIGPHSDLDLVLLHPPDVDVSDITMIADGLWYPIWDAGIRLDHSVRTVSQARRVAAQDVRVLLGLLDARTIAGDDALTSALRDAVLGDWRALAPRRLDELYLETQERAARHGELAHLLEPDLKNSVGGLRDLVTLRAVAASWVTDTVTTGLREPRRVLLDARDALQRLTGRAGDRLTAQEQPGVAELLGLADEDALLREVSTAARVIANASDQTWHRVHRMLGRPVTGVSKTRRVVRSQRSSRLPLTNGVVIQNGEAVLAADANPARDPVLLLRAAAAAAQAQLRLAPHAVDRLTASQVALPSPWPLHAREALVSLLGAGHAAVPVWEALDVADTWSTLIPPWSAVRSAPQRNTVHRYTVDRHLVETAVVAAGFTRRVSRPDLLLVGALLHDIGKGRGGDHTVLGMDIVASLAPDLGFDDADTEVLVRLVEHHLMLPTVATRRDLDDPATIESVRTAVRDREFLHLLRALSEADALATGPAAWSPWKAALIAELVARVDRALGPTPLPPETTDRADLGEALVGRVRVEGFAVDVEPGTDTAVVTVAAPDRVGLLATVAAVLTLHRLEIRSADIRTHVTADGPIALQHWSVLPGYADPPSAERIRQDLRRAAESGWDPVAAVRDRATRGGSGPAAVVDVVPAASARATIVEIRAHDSPGVLALVARAISTAGAVIRSARVATLGSEVVDVFYLVDDSGARLSSTHADAVLEAILGVLAAPVRPTAQTNSPRFLPR